MARHSSVPQDGKKLRGSDLTMSDIAIKVENLSKSYLLGHSSAKGERYTALRDVLANNARNLARKTRDMLKGKAIVQGEEVEEFWALKDINFEIKQGDRVGIIGRNGAGKSTLLKILSRITEPTNGRITITGRVASLLEVGTGFHPELTGRENIFLNGAILGMSRKEIQRKFDEIVDFAEVEKFLDTPVKRYSSGMYVRLAFSVAAHLEPEILIIDEVLAVGDADFQKKCMGKMDDISRSGRTILFVSHNMNAVESLCSRILVLDKGSILRYSDNVRSNISDYLRGQGGQENLSSVWRNDKDISDHPIIRLVSFGVVNKIGVVLNQPLRGNDVIYIVIEFEIIELDPALKIGFEIYDEEENLIFQSQATDGAVEEWPIFRKGVMGVGCLLPKRLFNEGLYRVELHVSLHCREWIFCPRKNSPIVYFEIRGGLSDSPYWRNARAGILAPKLEWNVL